jgi:hypothetical protein
MCSETYGSSPTTQLSCPGGTSKSSRADMTRLVPVVHAHGRLPAEHEPDVLDPAGGRPADGPTCSDQRQPGS